MKKKLEVILKTVERCNLNCTYCYFFNNIDKSYLLHPKYISLNTVKSIANFLSESIKANNFDKIRIYFHGGEPMMQKKADFDLMCKIFKEQILPKAELDLVIQTNGTLVTDEWIELFSKHQVGVGISLDGPKIYNDSARIDHRGKGTYDRVREGIKKLQDAHKENKIGNIAALTVINPAHHSKTIYRHFVDDLKIYTLDFLLPDMNYEQMAKHTEETGYTALNYGQYLCDIFDEWTKDDNPEISVRILNSALSLMTGGVARLLNFGMPDSSIEAITIASNGDISPDDTVRSADPALMNLNENVNKSTLKECLESKLFKTIKAQQLDIHENCKECLWGNVCGGGFAVHRYSAERGFNNPSVMCDGLKLIYKKIATYLLNNGYSRHELEKTLIA